MNMANKKAGKDILADILTGDHDHHLPGLDELTQLIRHNSKPQPAKKKKPSKKASRQQHGIKRKSTHYLSEGVFEDLGDARDTLKDMLPEEVRSQISKSGIVDTALKMILQELAAKGKDSVLFKQLKKDHKSE